MRFGTGARAVLTLVLLTATACASEVAAFDKPMCDELRRGVDNVDLARRVSSDPPGGDLECLVRIAAVRLSADDTVYESQSEPVLKRALAIDDLMTLDLLDTRRAIASRLRTAADPFTTDSLYRSALTTPARNDLFAQLASRSFRDAETMLVDRAPAPAPAPAELGAVGLAGLEAEDDAAAPGCLGAEAADDPDISRNAAALDGLCVARTSVADGTTTFPFLTVTSTQHPEGPVWYLPHDDEDQAFDAALESVRIFGGKLVAIATPETRELDGIDPNRAFAATDAEAQQCGTGLYPNYLAFVMGEFARSRTVLTIHNNPDGGNITARVRTAKLRGWRARRGPYRDLDNLVTFSGTAAFGRDRETRRMRDRLLGKGLNAVYEQVSERNNDCSISNYVLLHGDKPYFNLETETGSPVQDAMVAALMDVLDYDPVARR